MAAVFRLMTANLLADRCDVSDLARVISEVDPDVVVTQELGPFSAEVIQGAYPNHRLRPALDSTGRGIATRLEATFGEIDVQGHPRTTAGLDVGGQVVRLAGMHLRNPLDFPWWATARARQMQIDRLFNWLDHAEGPVVVAGDFNASPRWPVYKQTAGRLADLVADWADRGGVEPERTWAFRPGWPRMLRIDHVFGDGVAARDVRVERIAGTDHRAVIVDIEVVAPRQDIESPQW